MSCVLFTDKVLHLSWACLLSGVLHPFGCQGLEDRRLSGGKTLVIKQPGQSTKAVHAQLSHHLSSYNHTGFMGTAQQHTMASRHGRGPLALTSIFLVDVSSLQWLLAHRRDNYTQLIHSTRFKYCTEV